MFRRCASENRNVHRHCHRDRRNHVHHSLAGKPERCPSPGARERSLRAKRQSPQSRHSYQSRRYRRSGGALVTNWAFEMTLKMGDIVIARFTNSGQIKEFRGRIKGVTKNYWEDRVPGTCLAERSTWSGLPNRNHLCTQLLREQSNCEAGRGGAVVRITKTDLEKRVRSLERDNTLTHAALQAAVEGRIDWIGKRSDSEGNTYRFGLIDPTGRHGGILLIRHTNSKTGQKPYAAAQYLDDALHTLQLDPLSAWYKVAHELIYEARLRRNAAISAAERK